MERTGFEQWKPREVARLLALVETERRYYQEMVATLPAALVVLASDRTIVTANRAFRLTVNLRMEELRQKLIEQVLPSDQLIEAIRTAHLHGDRRPMFLNVHERDFRIHILPIRSWEDEAEPETLLMVEDMTGIEGAPALSAPVGAGLAALPAVVWEADAATLRFTSVRGAESILGYPPAYWIEQPQFISERIHPGDREHVMALYRSLAATGGEASAEFRAIAASGEAVWCRETVRVADVAGRGRIAAGVTTAIEQRRQLEEQSIAAGRADALRALAAKLAHDLNNPLMIVTGYSEEILQGLPAGDPLRTDLGEILTATRRMADLTAQLLAFARPALRPSSPFAFRQVLNGLREKLAVVAGKMPVELELEPAAADLWVLADREQLQEEVTALATAAIGNTRDSSGLTVSCGLVYIDEQVEGATLRAGAYALLEILVQGVGLNAAAGTLFESFLPSRDEPAGAGAAAARAYAAIRHWGGDVTFAGDPEQGSTFSLYLPCTEPGVSAPEISEEPVVEAPEPEPEPAPEPPRETILLVEDEPGIRGLVRKILRRENYVVVEAGSAEDAVRLEASLGDDIDLLLTDVMLPGMNGRELAEFLLAKHPDLRVVYISGYTDDASVRAGEFPPGARFLQKPFTLGALTGAVREALDQ
jgi:CheY-like chemotaxis protein/signal transduction histidine kinase